MRDEHSVVIRAAFLPLIGRPLATFSTAEIQHDDGSWESWPDLPIRLQFDASQVVAVSWSKFGDLWIATDGSLPFDVEGTPHRWVDNAFPRLTPIIGATIQSAWLGRGEMSIAEREVEIWTRLLIETTQGWLEIYNALDENGYDLHSIRPEGNFIRSA